MKLPYDFLVQMACQHDLSKDQEDVFLLRFGNELDYPEIAERLSTSPAACLKRMGQVYTKFRVEGVHRGKENRLRRLLVNHLQQTTSEPAAIPLDQTAPVETEQFIPIEVSKSQPEPKIPDSVSLSVDHNLHLHPRTYTTFIGRQSELKRLLELLSHRHSAHLISVDGIGGVGKTTLVLEAAYRCLQASLSPADSSVPKFKAIIFTSAKQQFLTPFKPLQHRHRERTLQGIYQVIARTLGRSLAQVPAAEQSALIQDWLSQQPTLLIVDNLETLDEQDEVLSFVYDLPAIVKVILTTREQVMPMPIRLTSLPERDGLALIQQEAEEKGISLTDEDVLLLYDRTSGIPAAMVYAIGQLAFGYELKEILSRVTSASGDVARFYFRSSIESIQGQCAYPLLLTLSIFPKPVSQETLIRIALDVPDPLVATKGLAKLQQLSLIQRKSGRYEMLPLTREYVLADLATERTYEQAMRDRWVDWGRCLATEYGSIDWNEWHPEYDRLEWEWENLQSVVEWCIATDRYRDVLALWQQIKGYADVRGYWEDRLSWTEWLIACAKQRNDPVMVEIMGDRARTLLLTRRQADLDAAKSLLEQAWELRDPKNFALQFEVVVNLIVLHLRGTEDMEPAKRWVEEGQRLLKNPAWKAKERHRQEIQLLYYQAETLFNANDFTQAKRVYERALKRAIKINWQRGISAIQNWLAEIAIAQENTREARRILLQGLLNVEQNKDKRAIALYQRSLAYLAKQEGDLKQAQRWAERSIENFENLRMMTEAENMKRIFEMDTLNA
jgi:tetratricopeptide (TPR) repeat protein